MINTWPLVYVLFNVWACPRYEKYHEGIMIAPVALRTLSIISEGYSRSVDTTHTLNDLLLGKPEDERHFLYMWVWFRETNYFERYVKGSYQ